jgi:hypothetical protein
MEGRIHAVQNQCGNLVVMKQKIDPQKVFEQAESFYRAWAVLHTMFLEGVSNKDIHAAMTLADPQKFHKVDLNPLM